MLHKLTAPKPISPSVTKMVSLQNTINNKKQYFTNFVRVYVCPPQLFREDFKNGHKAVYVL